MAEVAEETLGRINPEAVCAICGNEGDPKKLLVYVGCNDCLQMSRMDPPIGKVPDNEYCCSLCLSEGNRQPGRESVEIQLDLPVLNFLKTGDLDALRGDKAARICKRSQAYDFKDGQLYKKGSKGFVERNVPDAEERMKFIKQHHVQCGHFGVNKIESLLIHKYTWSDQQTYLVRNERGYCSLH